MPLNSLSSLADSPTSASRTKQLAKLRLQLLLQRRWSYLRYIHFREGLLAASNVKSALIVGAGRAIAELALAVEFPEIRFYVTDIESERTPNFKAAEKYAKTWNLPNIEFGVVDVTRPIEGRYDLVASIEVLEHIEDDDDAMSNMVAAARKFLFCLVPFADEAARCDPNLRARAWRRNEHYRYGYSEHRLRALLPDVVAMRGCYWKDRGLLLRLGITDLSDGVIRSRAEDLGRQALDDIADELPRTIDDAQGIWVLARTEPGAVPTEKNDGPRTRLDSSRDRIEEVKKRLVVLGSWSYFKYLHLREAFLETNGVETVLSLASGRGLVELALALEFPSVHFHLTESETIDSASISQPPSQAAELVDAWHLDNVSFGHHDVLRWTDSRFDMVCAVDLLAGIKNDTLAASNMNLAAEKYVFSLVPFAEASAQRDPARIHRAWEHQRRYRVGYSAARLRELFPGDSIVRGCFWEGSGRKSPSWASAVDKQSITPAVREIFRKATSDVRDRIPERYPEALGIWILTESMSE